MDHISPTLTVVFAVLTGMILGLVDFGSQPGVQVHVSSLIWGLFYGVGFEPAAIYYKLHGPYPYGFIDKFGAVVWPIIASAALYFVVNRLPTVSNAALRRKIKNGLTLSFVLVLPHHNLMPDELAYFPLWSQGFILTLPD
jgi:hypothetical protein